MLAWLCLVVFALVGNLWLGSLINPVVRWLVCVQADKPISWLDYVQSVIPNYEMAWLSGL